MPSAKSAAIGWLGNVGLGFVILGNRTAGRRGDLGLVANCMAKRCIDPSKPPDDLTWCVRCRKVRGAYGGWYGAQCFCDAPAPEPWEGPYGHWGPIRSRSERSGSP